MKKGSVRPGVMLPGGIGMAEAQRLAQESEAAGAESVWLADVRREPYLLSAAASFLPLVRARMIDENVPHHACGERKELNAVLILGLRTH